MIAKPHIVFSLLLAAFSTLGAAQVPTGYPGKYAETIRAAKKEARLVIYSTTDLAAASPLIRDFRLLYPGIEIEYNDMNSTEVHHRFLSETAAGEKTADVLWSSAMDLQMKLVNDGFAFAYKSPELQALPEWAVWRNEAFGTTFEPIVIVYNKRLLAPEEIPETHVGLAKMLREHPARFRGKVTTYDIEKSGVGFLLATQDSKTSPASWEVTRAMLDSGAKLQTATSAMMEAIASGENLIGYNLVGSYAITRARVDPTIGYVLPRDYTLVMSRIIFIAKRAKNINAARLWVDYLLSKRGQQIIANQSQLFSIRADVNGDATAAGLVKVLGASVKPIVVNQGLLTYLDQSKRKEFVKRWRGQ
jgi:iron(III) transport system substrate-binding protein